MHAFQRQSATRLSALLLVTAGLYGCGDNRTAEAPSRDRLLAARIVATAEIPTLYQCLSDLGTELRTNPGRANASLTCAAGTYRGQTSSGRPCELRVDGEAGLFRFQLDHDVVEIKLEKTMVGADGVPLHNLEDASAPNQPGIQLIRFTGAQMPVTEALILRFGRALPALPHMVYQRQGGAAPESTDCRFGK